MITYGHEKYVGESVESILMQETNFDFELIIADDCSPDNTEEVIKNIIKNHKKGHLVKYTKHSVNKGIMPNLLFALEQCKHKYIAMCEGDDFWVTTDKLQKQVDFLEAHPDYGLVYTHVKHFNQETNTYIEVPPMFPESEDDAIPMMLERKFIEFPSTVFRKDILFQTIETIKPELEYGIIGDTRILLETIQLSKIHFLNEVTTVYRVLQGSASHPTHIDKYIFALLDTYNCRKSFVKRHNHNPKLLKHSVCNTNRGLINTAFSEKKYTHVIKLLSAVLVKDTFKYCDFKTFMDKMSFKMPLKYIASGLGIGVLRKKFLN